MSVVQAYKRTTGVRIVLPTLSLPANSVNIYSTSDPARSGESTVELELVIIPKVKMSLTMPSLPGRSCAPASRRLPPDDRGHDAVRQH